MTSDLVMYSNLFYIEDSIILPHNDLLPVSYVKIHSCIWMDITMHSSIEETRLSKVYLKYAENCFLNGDSGLWITDDVDVTTICISLCKGLTNVLSNLDVCTTLLNGIC